MQLNEKIQTVTSSSVTVEGRVEDFFRANPSRTLIRLDQNLIHLALPQTVCEGMKEAAIETANPAGIQLTSPREGYDSLKKRISEYYAALGAQIRETEIFITGGALATYAAISRLFGAENTVVLPDPCEREVLQIQSMAGRTLRFCKAVPENNFRPLPPEEGADIAILSSPDSVTGARLNREELTGWVNWANANGAVLIFDASLSEFCEGEDAIHSIYEIPEARNCAIELFSFGEAFGSPEIKTAFCTVPQSINRNSVPLWKLFQMHQISHSSPPSFVMQHAAELLLSSEAQSEERKMMADLKEVSFLLSEGLRQAGIPHVGELSSPYIWAQCPEGYSSWQFFDLLLEKCGIVVTPGSNFGTGGENFFRMTAFGSPAEAKEAMERIAVLMEELQAAKEAVELPPVDLFG